MKKFLAFSLTTLAVLCMGLVLLNCNGDGGGCETHADCPEGQLCNPVTGDCYICTPNCAGKCCDDDGCGSTCPDNCPTGYICDTDCTCIPDVECTTDQRCIELYGANYTCNLTTNGSQPCQVSGRSALCSA